MLYDWTSTAALGVVRDIQPKEPLTLTGEGLWVCLISSGRCTASLTDASPSPAGSALILPPQSAAAGHLVLSRAPLTLTPEGESHLLCIQLTGQAAVQFLAGLTELPFLARGETCPAAAELLGRLAAEADTPRSRAASQLAFALLCELAGADSAAPPLPPLVEAAIEDIRQNYAGLYGVEELSERLGVSKSHLVRTFTAAVGVPPGRYLTLCGWKLPCGCSCTGNTRWMSLPACAASQGPTTCAGCSKKRPANPPHSGGPWPVRQHGPSARRKASGSRHCIFKMFRSRGSTRLFSVEAFSRAQTAGA